MILTTLAHNGSRVKLGILLLGFIFSGFFSTVAAQHSVARQWNEVLLESIRNDFARPTIHARNLFHSTVAMYDAWAAYDSVAAPYLLGDTVAGYYCPFNGISTPANVKAAREEAISYAMFRLIKYRFRNAPGFNKIYNLVDSVFISMGYDSTINSTNYASGSPAMLGNYITQCIIDFGHQDGANELNSYVNTYYSPVNTPLIPISSGNPNINNPNRWQPLTLDVFIDQAGNVIPLSTPAFLSPEWGDVAPFSLTENERVTNNRGGHDYQVYMDPGAPPFLGDSLTEEYMWTFSLVSTWSSHLDPSDSVMWDISPAGIGNLQNYPATVPGQRNFYDIINGGDNSPGHTINPVTGQPYAPQIVPRGDYTRVLAEFWADGPQSETPPGHWFTIFNYVTDHPQLQKKWRGQGPVLDDLEWDVKSYFALGGAMHDAAITAWSIKGWYDYIRPISAIRYLADQGQSSDTSLSNYSANGIPLIPGLIEVVEPGDPWADSSVLNIGKIKLYAWRGPDYINNPATDDAGVGWILAENWWPYQRPTFITPPFAGYISGHSTYSRTAAEVLTLITGDPYFPGGMSEFFAEKNNFLVFEKGPSTNVTLQWATYRDASDQCSLSRIWGGIHPPADDIPGRLIGMILGPAAFIHAESYMDKRRPRVVAVVPNTQVLAQADTGSATFSLTISFDEDMDTTVHPFLSFPSEDPLAKTLTFNVAASNWMNTSAYIATFDVADSSETLPDIDVQVESALDLNGNLQETYLAADNFSIDTKSPFVLSVAPSSDPVTTADIGVATFSLTVQFDEAMDTSIKLVLSFPNEDPLTNTLTQNMAESNWLTVTVFEAKYDVANSSESLVAIDVDVMNCTDKAGNIQVAHRSAGNFSIDTKRPAVLSVTSGTTIISDSEVGPDKFSLTITFDKEMDTLIYPVISFPAGNPMAKTLTNSNEFWTGLTTFEVYFDVADSSETLSDIDVEVAGGTDIHGNVQAGYLVEGHFSIDTENPSVLSVAASSELISDSDTGIATFTLTIDFSEDMDIAVDPVINFPVVDSLLNSLVLNAASSSWVNAVTYEARYDVATVAVNLQDVDVHVSGANDVVGNSQLEYTKTDLFSIVVKGLVGIGNYFAGEPVVKVYPNPVFQGDKLRLEFQHEQFNFKWRLYNSQGQEALFGDMANGAFPYYYINITGMQPGIYLLHMDMDKVRTSHRILILNN